MQNKALTRVLLASLLAKAEIPERDVRKPYTQIGTDDAFSGRTYDEVFVGPFLRIHRLPSNATTGFLTPALRNQAEPLLMGTNLVGRPKAVYDAALRVLDTVQSGDISARDALAQTLRSLIELRDEDDGRMQGLLERLASAAGALPLSTEAIFAVIVQHLALPGTSRLPVLLVSALYDAAHGLGEQVKPLRGHNAADAQTGALGDVEIVLEDQHQVVTAYEMKDRPVTRGDIDLAIEKTANASVLPDNYLFVTTAPIDPEVAHYAKTLYEQTGGMEMMVLDVKAYVRHILHFLHRHRGIFLDAYQQQMMNEPDSAVSRAVKEAFLAMRHAAEDAA